METYLQIIKNLSAAEAFLLFLAINIGIFTLSELLGKWFIVRYRKNRITDPPKKITAIEIILSVTTVLLNSVVTSLGLWLWQNEFIRITFGFSWLILLDFLVLFFVMDLLMYVFHRIAHVPFLYRIIHQTHHDYKALRPLTLFVLNPIECLGFGAMWLVLLCVYSANWYAISAYLALNVLFGLVGHLGVEPFSKKSQANKIAPLITTSYFHAQHHNNEQYNFGFYTTIYDRLFGTISRKYDANFGEKLD